MEELFQLILALFVLSFPLLSILSRRRQAGRTRRRESGTPSESSTPREGRWSRRRRRGAEGAAGGENVAAGAGSGAGAGEPPGAGAERPQSARRREGPKRGEPVAGGRRGPADGATTASNRPRRAANVTRNSEIRRGGPTVASAGQPRQPESAALEYIAARSRLQQAVIWAEVLGRPKALRRTPEPWDDEGSP